MKIYPRTRPIQRDIALDIHKEYVLAGGMNAKPEWVLPPRSVSPYWKEQYEKFFHRMRRESQAIVVVARKLLVAVWHVLSKEETDERASEEDLAYKMLLWSWSLSEDARQGLSYKQFAKYALMRLGVQTDITRFVRGNVPRRIASKEEVLKRMTELGLSC